MSVGGCAGEARLSKKTVVMGHMFREGPALQGVVVLAGKYL
jgi:hypothetical protein